MFEQQNKEKWRVQNKCGQKLLYDPQTFDTKQQNVGDEREKVFHMDALWQS